jgi:hypothetical protein
MSGEGGHCTGHIVGDPGYLPGHYYEPDRDDNGPSEGYDPWWAPVVMVTGIVMLFFGPLLVDVLRHVLKLFESAGSASARDAARRSRGRDRSRRQR